MVVVSLHLHVWVGACKLLSVFLGERKDAIGGKEAKGAQGGAWVGACLSSSSLTSVLGG